MEEKHEQITFINDEGIEESFFVVEETKLNGINYLLVTDSDDEEANAWILKEKASESDEDSLSYEMLEDEKEMDSICMIFEELLEDIDFEKE